MLYKILMVSAAVLGVLQFPTIQDRFAKGILAGLILSIVLTLLPNDTLVQAGFFLYSASVLAALIYAGTRTGLDMKTRILIFLICFPVLLVNIYALGKFPRTAELSLSMIVPIIAFVILVFTNRSRFKTELAFLTIIAVDAAVKLSIAIEWLFLNK